ncbi:CCA tRNA nucleotidyltransferase [Bacillus fonticola]|uniref:CCA tRNA nucleotidyltransferase n=1 Tax=Bacillus fonticola TaxID=2728853 RepID=UPI001474A344|nr:CCA tRNA nucleotidyltransferase [Bacillus fonticola]
MLYQSDEVNPFQQAKPVLETLLSAGYEAYFVGGSVRDLLLGREVGDIDITTSATPEQVQTLFQKTVPVGIEHGTVLVIHKGQGYEVTTFRTEGTYADHRHPASVQFVQNVEEDLMRRDFTMNAIAMTVDGQWIDPFRGKEAIESHTIASVGDAHDRFQEDALRMMRAVRFQSQLGFTLTEKVDEAIRNKRSLLKHVAMERNRVEFHKLLNGLHCHEALKVLFDTGLHEQLPVLCKFECDARSLLLEKNLSRLNHRQIWAFILEVLRIDSAFSIAKEWKFSREETKAIEVLLTGFRIMKVSEWTKWCVYTYGKETATDIEQMIACWESIAERGVHLIWESLPISSRKQLAVTGNDLLRWRQSTGGPWVKNMLQQIEKHVVEGSLCNDRAEIKERVLAWGNE